jgi:hypothetical protein
MLVQTKTTELSWWAQLIFWFVAINAFAGAFILILLPTRTDSLFFWPIDPPINAALFGALYLGGAVVVALAAWRNAWEPARFLVPILVTAGILISGVTLLHLDRFAAGVRLAYWLLVYVGAPLLALLIYVVQERRRVSGWQPTVPLNPLTRSIAIVTGAILMAASLLIIIWPQLVVANWPWPTGVLMVRIFAAWFGAFGAGLLWFWVEQDWRNLVQIPNLMIAASGLDLLMVFFYRQQIPELSFNFWVYCGHLLLFGLLGLLMHGLQYRYAGLRQLAAAD